MAAEEFRKDVINLPGMCQHDGWSDLSAAKLVLEQLRAFRCEGLICMALTHVLSKSASASSMKWSRDVVRNALGDVSGCARCCCKSVGSSLADLGLSRIHYVFLTWQ